MDKTGVLEHKCKCFSLYLRQFVKRSLMNKLSLLFCALCIIAFSSCEKNPDGADADNGPSVMIMSFNVRTSDTDEENPFDLWQNRRDACCAMINNVRPVMMGVQECTKVQRDYIKSRCRDYDVVGRSSDNDPNASQNAVFYLRDSVSVLESGMFWLTETPEVLSKLPGANHYRAATWIKTLHISSGEVFYIINTHLSSTKDQIAVRDKQISVILDYVKKKFEDYPVVMTGDWNQGDDHQMFNQVYQTFKNARYAAVVSDKGTTWNGFDGSSTGKLDHIFYRGFASCSKFGVERRAWAGHAYISDHYPIYAILNF